MKKITVIAALAAVLLAACDDSGGGGRKAGSTFKDCSGCPEMVNIPAGNFTMGADKNFEEASDDETPHHKVAIAKPFAIGKYEVTQAEWVAVMGNNPSKFKGKDQPVDQVSWDDAKQFISKLNAKTGKTYRLPTEAEWEFAVRAGSGTAYSFGDDKGQLGQYAWFGANSGDETHPIGQLKPNAFGLHDMHGNVWEWVEDCWNDSYDGAPANGSAWTTGNCRRRVLRGGSWSDDLRDNYSSNRIWDAAGGRGDDNGLRLARTL